MRFLIALALAAPLFAQPCTYVLSQTSYSIPAAQFTSTVKVTQTADSACGNYTASVPSQFPWIHITGGTPGIPGDAGVTFTVEQNLSAVPRTGFLVIALTNVTVTQEGANCSFSMTPTSQNFPVVGGSDTFRVQAGCVWRAASNVNWIAVTANNGVSNVAVSYSVAANTCAAPRNGVITLQQTNLPNPPALAVTQNGSPNNLLLLDSSGNSIATVGANASDGRITVTTGLGCGWSATRDVSWIQITFGAGGSGNGGISYHLLQNTTVERTGHIIVGTATYTITQQAPGPPAPSLAAVANAANYNADAVSPGEIVSLFGSNMGPASIVGLQVTDGIVTNSLAGTQVLFDGVAAPMIYTLKGQVSAVVPYGVAGKASTQVQVQYVGAVSNTMTVPVRAATPAIFSLDSSGVGPGAILNQDTSVNTTGNPAARLSVISLYCTGGGALSPASPDGAVIGVPPPVLSQSAVVTVTIGGVNASVKYAGTTPGAVSGLTQINVEVPAGLAPGLFWPVVVKIGDFASTGSVTVAVK